MKAQMHRPTTPMLKKERAEQIQYAQTIEASERVKSSSQKNRTPRSRKVQVIWHAQSMKPIAAKPTARAPVPKLRMLATGAIVAAAALEELEEAVPEAAVAEPVLEAVALALAAVVVAAAEVKLSGFR